MIATLILTLSVLYTSPASNPEGRLISVEESQNRAVYPQLQKYYWASGGEVTTETSKKLHSITPLPVSRTEGISYGEVPSRNEFGCEKGYFPSPDGERLAVYRKDERSVGTFPLLDIDSRTGSLKQIRYPMNGMASEKLGLVVCDLCGNILSEIKVDDFTDERYLTGVTWSPDGKYIFVQVLDRAQHRMKLNQYRSDDGSFVRTILSEENEAWIEPQDPLYFLKGSYEFIYRTDNRDGYRNLYLCDTLGRIRRLTPCDADVSYVGNDGKYVYYTSAEVSPVENHLFRVEIRKGKIRKPVRITKERGWHEISFYSDMTRFLDVWSNFTTPGVTQLREADGKLIEELQRAENPLKDYAKCEVEFGTVKSADGSFDNYYRLLKPLDFDPSRKYPLIVYVYGGPHSQMVRDSWLGSIRMWEMVMAQRGYVVYVQDNRGTENRGAGYEKAINRQCGQVEMADQMAGINELLQQSWIDRERVGVHGWSYGGFMTISLMTNYPDVFKTAVAGGPVIDWKWYEVMYGERYMDTEESNPEGFARTSLINKAGNLKGKLLICQGAVDQTVVWEHSLSFVQECIEKGVQLDYFPYPMDEHNMRGKARVHLYHKITDYFERFL